MTNSTHSWRTLAAAGASMALSVVLVHVPAALWAGNNSDLQFSAIAFLGLGALLAAAGVGLVALGMRLLPVRVQAVMAGLLGAMGLIAWAYGLLLPRRMNVLDALGAPMDFARAPGWWELPLVGTLGIVLAAVICRFPRGATRLFVLFNVGLIGASAGTILTAREGSVQDSGDLTAVFRFSRQTNVLVILLDGLQSDVAERAIARRPSLTAAFDGFTLYRDTLGTATTTFLSVPAMHSGDVYRGQGRPGSYFVDAITRRSFVTRFADAGYETSLVNPLQNVCPARTAACVSIPQVLGTTAEELQRESLRLLDVSLFRTVPFRLKPSIYRDGRWLVGSRLGRSAEAALLLDGNRMFDAIASRLTISAARPTLKFLHSLSTHTPYILNADCASFGADGLGHAVIQGRCALEAVGRLLERLDRAGIYDNTAILVVADHGMNPGVFGGAPPGSDEAWEHLSGSAHPLFLFKPLARRGGLEVSAAPVYLADVGATLCAATAACAVPLGYPAGQAAPDRPRRFADYVWRNEFWRTGKIPGLVFYEVRGPLDRPGSWYRLN
jgi:hypothetical protein